VGVTACDVIVLSFVCSGLDIVYEVERKKKEYFASSI